MCVTCWKQLLYHENGESGESEVMKWQGVEVASNSQKTVDSSLQELGQFSLQLYSKSKKQLPAFVKKKILSSAKNLNTVETRLSELKETSAISDNQIFRIIGISE